MDEVRSLRPRKVGELFSLALDLYGKSWARLMAIAAIVTVPLTLVQYYLWDSVRDIRPTTFGFEAARGSLARTAVASAVVGILGFFIYQVLVGAVARSAAGVTLGRDLGIGDAYRFGYARMWSILLVGLLVALSVMGGFLLLVIPGFFVMTRLFAAIPALVIEGKRGRAALRRSWFLVEGHGWRVFGIIILVGLITGLVSSVFAIATDQGWLGQAVAAALSGIVTGPFTALVGTLLYLDLRARSEKPTITAIGHEFDLAGSST
jgi:glycerophosphoryl diester phosphodiesterase family protein